MSDYSSVRKEKTELQGQLRLLGAQLEEAREENQILRAGEALTRFQTTSQEEVWENGSLLAGFSWEQSGGRNDCVFAGEFGWWKSAAIGVAHSNVMHSEELVGNRRYLAAVSESFQSIFPDFSGLLLLVWRCIDLCPWRERWLNVDGDKAAHTAAAIGNCNFFSFDGI